MILHFIHIQPKVRKLVVLFVLNNHFYKNTTDNEQPEHSNLQVGIHKMLQLGIWYKSC